MPYYRRAQLAAAPTIEIGDINDITGTISDKGSSSSPYYIRHLSSSNDSVAAVQSGDWNVGLANTTGTINIDVIADSTTRQLGLVYQGTDPWKVRVSYRNFNYATLFSSTNITSEVTSSWVQVNSYYVKTVSVYSANASGTLTIEVTPTDSTDTAYTYYTDNVEAATFTTKSFTEAFYYVRIKFNPSDASTLDAWITIQT